MKSTLQTNPKQYEQAILQNPRGSFLQSIHWKTFQEALNRKTWLLSIQEENKIFISSLLVKVELPFNQSYLYVPYGPLFHANNKDSIESFYNSVIDLASKEKVTFIKFEPNITTTTKSEEFLRKKLNCKVAKDQLQPHETATLDITKSEDELLKSFHKKTRYNIRLSERKGVTVKVSTDPQDIEIFYNLATETKTRNQFGIHSKEYYQKQFEILLKEGIAKLYIGYHNETPIAANIVLTYNNTTTYLHGASSNEHRNLMAPQLLQWKQILDAKEALSTTYDFWGITTSKDPNHPWSGITRFKSGFNPEFITYTHGCDVPIKKLWYYAYRLKK